MLRHLPGFATAGAIVIALGFGGPAMAQKSGGTLRLSHFDSPASMSILEEATRAALQPERAVAAHTSSADSNSPAIGKIASMGPAGDVPSCASHLLARAIRGRYYDPRCGVFRRPRRPHARLLRHRRQGDLGLRYRPRVRHGQRCSGSGRIDQWPGRNRCGWHAVRQLRLQLYRVHAGQRAARFLGGRALTSPFVLRAFGPLLQGMNGGRDRDTDAVADTHRLQPLSHTWRESPVSKSGAVRSERTDVQDGLKGVVCEFKPHVLLM